MMIFLTICTVDNRYQYLSLQMVEYLEMQNIFISIFSLSFANDIVLGNISHSKEQLERLLDDAWLIWTGFSMKVYIFILLFLNKNFLRLS